MFAPTSFCVFLEYQDFLYQIHTRTLEEIKKNCANLTETASLGMRGVLSVNEDSISSSGNRWKFTKF